MTSVLFLAPLLFVQATAGGSQPDQQLTDKPDVLHVDWAEGREVVIAATPRQAVTVILQAGEQIRRVTLGQEGMITVQVDADRERFTILPLDNLSRVSLLLETDQRLYPFFITRSDRGSAPHIIRVDVGDHENRPASVVPQAPPSVGSSYRLRGDRSARPANISDDGQITFIDFFPDQPLPAVFAIGPTGQEEVVNGHFREGRYVIDRVYGELVFRIDKARATARRAEVGDGR
jgi:type IV secretion system protein VirB9